MKRPAGDMDSEVGGVGSRIVLRQAATPCPRLAMPVFVLKYCMYSGLKSGQFPLRVFVQVPLNPETPFEHLGSRDGLDVLALAGFQISPDITCDHL